MAVNKVVKYLLFTFNFLFFISGAVILGVSVHAMISRAEYQITDELLPPVQLLVCVGTVTLVFGFLACCGAIGENRCLLVLFFLGLLGLLILLLSVGVLGALARTEDAQSALAAHLETLRPLGNAPQEVRESFGSLERAGKCCGFSIGHEDWGNSSLAVPDSCNCTDVARNCTELDGRQVYATPCLPYLMTWLDCLSDILMGVAFAFAAMMVLGMAFSLTMLCQISGGKAGVI
ncbi:hypothetical protein NHX12_001401 [Muraenolepis orangiensis]|uniref:Tetraspanin n=1 Tax=Muraenolepis orangiensis TaxID=630683 RepID=A0A9Q0DZM1_9TELE|nr:hypothetical protein NHX12_001401 [Muraenolepis orangiensis]